MKKRLAHFPATFLPFLATLFGSICFGLLFVAIFVNATQVNCIRKSAGTYTCQLRTLLLGTFPISQRSIQNVTGINIAENADQDGVFYRAVFTTSGGGAVPLSSTWTDLGPVSQQVTAIRSQMTTDAEQISYTASPPWWVLFLIGGLVIMVMLLSALFFFRR
ncbi:MAG TPA: hypothetical protein VLZ89_02550 [Anaerolineales bacterium]|nr:hypothetical protein [Anaerolineales bacterium]